MNIFVKYCGGCNPRYDRKAFAGKLEDTFPEHIFSEKYDDPDISLIICGCSSACAGREDAAAPYGIYTVWSGDCAGDAAEFIRETQRAIC